MGFLAKLVAVSVIGFLHLSEVSAVGTPFGLAAGTTGGGSATAATPSSLAELATWLSDSTARVIVLDKVFDYTNSEGTITGPGCKPWTCTPNPQLAIDGGIGWCSDTYEDVTVTYYAAATKPLVVGNNKTLLGKGSGAGIKGKGLRIVNGNNIIIQNIAITNLNAQFVWGGDALSIEGGNNIWIDHNYFQFIGRQHIVTHYGGVSGTTISNNVFNGESTYSASCNGKHYWVAFFTGAGDHITFAYNHLYKTSGRGPHVGGTSGNYQTLHIYNNYFNQIGGHAIDPEVGSKVLIEGNYFNAVDQPSTTGAGGQGFAPTTSAQAALCSTLVGRNCVTNVVGSSSGTLYGSDTGTMNAFTSATFKSASIKAAADVPAYVQANAGLGIVN